MSNKEIKYPDIEVPLSECDGNAFAIMGMVSRHLKKAGVEKSEQDTFFKEASSGDYDHVIQTCMKWVNVV